jgi:hypothetical protein
MKTKLLEALEIRFDSDAGDDLTVREYLRTLLTTLWEEEEGFSGKRPFGNSGWKYELYRPLIAAGLIEGGTLDSEGYVDSVGNGEEYVNDLILAMCHGVHEG